MVGPVPIICWRIPSKTTDPRDKPEDDEGRDKASLESPDPHSCRNDEKADGHKRKNVLNDSRHISLLSLYVLLMFYFCSKVNINLVAYRPVEVGAFGAGYGLWG
jgi:hypothetical protein